MPKKRALSAILPLVIFVVWSLVTYAQVVPPQLLPSPLKVGQAFVRLVSSGILLQHLKVSIIRAAIGFSIGALAGGMFGTIAGYSQVSEYLLDSTIQLGRMIPHLAILPLFILWFGFGELSKVLIVASGAFFPVYVNTFLGIRSVDAKLIEVSDVLEFTQWQKIKKIIVPSAMPNILLGIRMSMGTAWLSLIVAELMGASSGVGYMISDAREFSKTDVVIVGIFIFAIVGKLSDSFVRFLEKRLLAWRQSYAGTP